MKRFATLLSFVLLLMATAATAGEEEELKQAVAAAESWLLLADAGEYGESWVQASAKFQSAITKAKWEQASVSVRKPLGALKTREVMTGGSAPRLVPMPDGEAVVIQFTSSFENLPAALETVSPRREADGSWRVSGYFIKPAPKAEQPPRAPLPGDAPRRGAAWPSDGEIREILRSRVDVAKSAVGIVVGLVDDSGTRIISYGKTRQGGDQTVDGDSVFEIGSITKTFTALLLSDMVEKGEVELDDPISKFLPKTVKAHKVNDKEITLVSLSRHISGLPRLPNNFSPKDAANPYADYTVKDMYAFLDKYKSTLEIGRHHEYSNFGVGLLGHVLALRGGTDYESLLRTRVLQPLKMTNTAITLTLEMKSRLAQGHRNRLPVANWDIPTLAGAGALRSSANDMLKYLAANLDVVKTPLLAAMERTHAPVSVSRFGGQEMGLGWLMRNFAETKAIEHGGATGGYRAFVGMDKKNRRGVVVLANSTATDVENIGGHLIDGGFSLTELKPAPVFKAIKLDAGVFDAYAGTYQVESGPKVVFSREGERFFARIANGPQFEIFADTETHFFSNDVDTLATFVKGEKGAWQLAVRDEGRDLKAKKIE